MRPAEADICWIPEAHICEYAAWYRPRRELNCIGAPVDLGAWLRVWGSRSMSRRAWTTTARPAVQPEPVG
jgi:hypothetical protein